MYFSKKKFEAQRNSPLYLEKHALLPAKY